MTVALALAMRSSDGRPALGVIADTRLTLRAGASLDTFIKAVELGPESILVMAGDSTLPATVAAEVTRPLVRSMHANARGESPPVRVSLLEEVRQLASAHVLVHRGLGAISTASIAAGFFGDGSPGLVRIGLDVSAAQITVSRPELGGVVVVGVGSASIVGLGIDALRIVQPRTLDGALGVLASVVWASIQAEDVPGVGGGLLLGYCLGLGPWTWPAARIAGQTFYRGFPISGTPDGWEKVEYGIEYDSTLLARVTEERPPAAYDDHLKAPIVTSISPFGGTSETRDNIPLDWTLTRRECEVLGVVEPCHQASE